MSWFSEGAGVPLRQDPLLEKLAPLRRASHNTSLGLGIALLSVGLAVLMRFWFGNVLAIGTFITFYPAVIFTAIIGRFWPGMLSVGLSLVAADYFFIPPVFSLSLTSGQVAAMALFAFNLTLIVIVISLLHAAMERLWQEESKLRFLLDTEPAGLIAVDGAGTINLVNRAAEEHLGYSHDELIGQKIEVLLPERLRDAHSAYRRGFMLKPETRAMGAGRDLFALRRDGTEIPVEVGLNPIRREGKVGALATVLDISERKAAERRQQILVHEVQHRARNLLGIVQAVAARTFVPERLPAESRQMFMTTLAALARTLDLFAGKGAASLKEIVDLEAGGFRGQIMIEGPDVRLTEKSAENVSLIVHELCTNSLKHGSLSQPKGTVSVQWRCDEDSLVFSWIERGGPAVVAPQRTGFGQTILIDMARDFAADVSVSYPPTGFQYALTAKLSSIAEPASSGGVLVA